MTSAARAAAMHRQDGHPVRQAPLALYPVGWGVGPGRLFHHPDLGHRSDRQVGLRPS